MKNKISKMVLTLSFVLLSIMVSLIIYLSENEIIQFGYSFLAGVIIAITVVFIIHHYTHQLGIKRTLKYKRCQMLYDMTGEMMFKYNYLTDELKISNSGLNKLATQPLIENFSENQISHNQSNYITDVIYQCLMRQEDVNCDLELTLLNHEKNWYQLTIKIIKDIHKNSEHALYAIGKFINIQKYKSENEKLKHSIMIDALTGLYNRVGAKEIISKKLLNQETQSGFIMLDLDDFKAVNDQYGHLGGDVVLQQLTDLLLRVFKDSVIARYGGDEFIIYTDNIDKAKINVLCERVLQGVRRLPFLVERDKSMTMSIGIVFTNDKHDFETLIKYADEKLYEVKQQGKNGYKIYCHNES